MSIKTKLAAVGSSVILLSSALAFADLEVKPYGAVQYRLRFQHNSLSNEWTVQGEDPDPIDHDGSFGSFDYSHRLCWRTGMRVSVDDKLSLQFQIGNDWGAAENVNWSANNSPFGRVGTQNLYVHIASVKWNPGPVFIDAGVLSINSNGTLDLLTSSLGTGTYGSAGFNGWGDMNNSVIGLRLGLPIVKEGVKVGAELLHSVIDNRTQSISGTTVDDPKANPASLLTVFTLPVDAGDFKITPELTAVWNRNFNSNTEGGDHEILVGLAGSYKINDQVSLTFNGGYGMVSNENSQAGGYGQGMANTGTGAWRSSADAIDDFASYSSEGMLLGLGATIRKLGPGDLQIGFNYNNSKNSHNDTTDVRTNTDQVYTDLRYAVRLHPRFTFTPRYRTYTTLLSDDELRAKPRNVFRMDNRFELIVEGSF